MDTLVQLVAHVLEAALHGRLLERSTPPHARPCDASWYLRKREARATHLQYKETHKTNKRRYCFHINMPSKPRRETVFHFTAYVGSVEAGWSGVL